MPNRREFLAQAAITFVGAGLGATANTRPTAASEERGITEDRMFSAPTQLRLLVLGGTGFIGPHHVRAALARGHRVSVFSRGRRATELPSGVELLTGDRNGDLESIRNRDWDAVLDLATYAPIWIRTLGQALKDRVKHYTYISTVSVYDQPIANDEGTVENSKRAEYQGADAYSITKPRNLTEYGALKALCEREAEGQFPERTLIVRPGTIVGPGDIGGVFTYWAMRMEAGGEILVAGDPLSPVQMIDVRDMADWVVRMVEIGTTGPFNLVGPALPIGWAEFLGALRGTTTSDVTLTWVPVEWIKERGVSAPTGSMLFWPVEVGFPGIMRMRNEKVRAQGLTFRPIAVTSADTRAWFKDQALESQKQLLMGFDGANRSLEVSMVRERELLTVWHSREGCTKGRNNRGAQ